MSALLKEIRHNPPLWLLTFASVVFAAAPGRADEVYLKSGGQLSGRIVSRTENSVEIDIGAGRVKVPTSSVVRVEEGRSALEDYEDRARAIAPGDAAGWTALGEWASARGLGTQAGEAYERALGASPEDPRANAALGRVQIDGRWMSEEEGYRARGYVQHEGEWMTPAEQEAILRSDRERRSAEARAREAEARAEEAEAAAAAAQAAASEEVPWYGWGGGPAYWPMRPIVTRPVAPARPVARPVRPR
jgi:hypothetical protein